MPLESAQIAHAADVALDAVAAGSEEWATSVRRLRFETHNAAWLHLVRSLEGGELASTHEQQEQELEQGEPVIGAFWPPGGSVVATM